MLTCFTRPIFSSIPIVLVTEVEYPAWLKKQNKITQNWLQSSQFRNQSGQLRLIPSSVGKIERVVYCVKNLDDFWNMGLLPLNLPTGAYHLENETYLESHAIAWGLGAYQFTLYKKADRWPAQLVLPKQANQAYIHNMVESIYWVRDLINQPTDDMGPTEFASASLSLGKQYSAHVKQIIGEHLLKKNYASIYTVGRASDDPPRLIDLRWGNRKHRKVTLVGKGVCFDSGGLDIKPSSAMLLMKKDMAGGAHVLGLARMIMEANLPIALRVLIPVVENVISGNAYRPGDIIRSRKGLTIEVGNTDAEGRVILADALTEAVSEKPDLLIDISTLTGAARVALGTDLPAVFCNNDTLLQHLLPLAKQHQDPIWPLPLFDLYRDSLNTPFADINNNSTDVYGGAITAALFLKEFVPDDIPWLHFDMMAWNLKSRPGRPQGGEAMALRALFHYLKKA